MWYFPNGFFHKTVQFSLDDYQRQFAQTELHVSLKNLDPKKVLIQLGLEDDWLDEEARKVYQQIEAQGYELHWYQEGHSLAGQDSQKARWEWLEQS